VYAFKEVGKVSKLKQLIEESKPDLTKVFDSHAGIAHTRWATHGPPSRVNCHPHRFVALESLAFSKLIRVDRTRSGNFPSSTTVSSPTIKS
jgi:hypothetical protein